MASAGCASPGSPARLLCWRAQVQMETPDHCCKAAAMEQDCATPRRVLDKENSDDFSYFAGLQEGPATAALFGCARCRPAAGAQGRA